jgi:O-methyltransferase
MLRPILAFFNKSFHDSPYGKPLQQVLTQTAKSLPLNGSNDIANDIGAYMFDDMLVWLKNLGFLKDPDFIAAVGNYKSDTIVMTKIWRIWIVASTLASTWQTEGISLDIGTYDGKSIEIALDYCMRKFDGKNLLPKQVMLYDAFENPPEESKKTNHSPTLHVEVEERLKRFANVSVHKGFVPDVLDSSLGSIVRWAQIDLNSAEYDSAAFIHILPRLAQGAIVVFDDYGFLRYKDTQAELNRIVSGKDLSPIIELPTGQGIYVHG